MWLCKYPRPTMIVYDRRNEFFCYALKNDLIKNEYGIKSKCETTENTQETSILEIIHQVIANLLRTLDCQNNYLDEDDPCSGILSAIYLAVRSSHH